MDLFVQILLGGLAVFVGYLFIRYSRWFVRNVGRIGLAEKYLGNSYNFYKLFGIIIMFFGFLGMTGLLGGFIMSTVGKLFGISSVNN